MLCWGLIKTRKAANGANGADGADGADGANGPTGADRCRQPQVANHDTQTPRTLTL